jgi:lipopolysaccharide/colanic/teichoic acid biosynthesis glycosyltransferase
MPPSATQNVALSGYADDSAFEDATSAQLPARAHSVILPASSAAQIHRIVAAGPLCGTEARPVYQAVKRVCGAVFSAVVLVAFCWLYALIALIIKLDDPHAPVIYKQTRVGQNGQEFTMHKFRTMVVGAEDQVHELAHLNEKTGPVFKITNDPRSTRPGRLLRKTSLDELPQFWDVLMGKMCVVGPRPALPSEVAKYTPYQRQRLLVKPGITCFWQTRQNRDSVSFDEWVDLDLLYIKTCSLWIDIKQIFSTIKVVLTHQGH